MSEFLKFKILCKKKRIYLKILHPISTMWQIIDLCTLVRQLDNLSSYETQYIINWWLGLLGLWLVMCYLTPVSAISNT